MSFIRMRCFINLIEINFSICLYKNMGFSGKIYCKKICQIKSQKIAQKFGRFDIDISIGLWQAE